MTKRTLNIGRWLVVFLFAGDGFNAYEVLRILKEAGASRDILAKAEETIVCDRNCGFTYTDDRNHLAIVFVGPTTGGDEFIDTLVHEVHHLSVAIADGLGVDLRGEDPAYIAGDSARALARTICLLGCSKCRDHIADKQKNK